MEKDAEQKSLSEKSKKQNTTGKLAQEWATFLSVLLSPSILILVVVTIGLIALRLSIPPGTTLPPVVDAVFTVMIAIFSGLAGKQISERWSKITEASSLWLSVIQSLKSKG